MSVDVAIIGEGLLADAVCKKLITQYEIVRLMHLPEDLSKLSKLILILHDDSYSFSNLEIEKALLQARIPWLRGMISFNEGMVGPFVRPSVPGCAQCADHRRSMAGNGMMAMQEISEETCLFESGIWQMVHFIVAEIEWVLQVGRALTEEHMYIINLETLQISRHFFLPDPLCSFCGKLTKDRPDLARISLQARPKINSNSYRSQALDDLQESLIKDYQDARMGLINVKMNDLVSPFAAVNVTLPSFIGNQIAGGKSHRYTESELIAVLEGLERYCGQTPRGKHSTVHDSFENIAGQALDPHKVGLYSKEQYDMPDFPFEPFDSKTVMDWVWGYSFLQERPILIPESLAYYSAGYGKAFVQEGSNGCALGGSLEEAILHGILEVVERDALLMTWYMRLPVPRLDPRSSHDQELLLMIEKLRAVADYDVHFFNMTMENRIPSILAIAKSNNPYQMNLICASAAHLDPVKAAKNALHELSGYSVMLQEKFEERREEVEHMLHHSSLVLHMEDHLMLYSLPQSEERLHFLLNSERSLRTFDQEFKNLPHHVDLTDDLKDIIQVFLRLNLDVIVVDQTAPEILRNGLHCVKVLIPGMLPMTYGHHLNRVTGLERLFKIPVELGYIKQSMTPDKLNPYPHPFF